MSTGCYTVRAQRAYPAPCVSPRWAAPHRGFLLPKKNRPSQPCPCMACGRFRYWLPEGPAGPCDRLATKSGLRIIASTMSVVYSVYGSSVKRTGDVLRQTYAIEDRSLPGKHRVNVPQGCRLNRSKWSRRFRRCSPTRARCAWAELRGSLRARNAHLPTPFLVLARRQLL